MRPQVQQAEGPVEARNLRIFNFPSGSRAVILLNCWPLRDRLRMTSSLSFYAGSLVSIHYKKPFGQRAAFRFTLTITFPASSPLILADVRAALESSKQHPED